MTKQFPIIEHNPLIQEVLLLIAPHITNENSIVEMPCGLELCSFVQTSYLHNYGLLVGYKFNYTFGVEVTTQKNCIKFRRQYLPRYENILKVDDNKDYMALISGDEALAIILKNIVQFNVKSTRS